MDGLREKKYLQITKKRFDPLALVVSAGGLFFILFNLADLENADRFFDLRSMIIVFGGTLATLLFQFDFTSVFRSIKIIFISFLGTPEKLILAIIRQLDDAILNDMSLSDLREGSEINGELLNDIVYMYHQGLLFDEIDRFITSRIADDFLNRKIAMSMLNRAATIAPALGLFGTVMGLVGVLSSLSNPSEIGPSMSLALMTTVYGAGLGSLIFTPLAGRLEHHNSIYIEVHKQLMSKVGILLTRDERRFEPAGEQEVMIA